MMTRKDFEAIAWNATVVEHEAKVAMDRAQGEFLDMRNKWEVLVLTTREAQRAVDEWQEPVVPIVPVIPFV